MTKIVYFAPKGFDYLSNQLTEGFHLLSKEDDIEFVCTNKVVHHGAQLEDLVVVTDEEASDNISDADLILFSTGGDFEFRDGIRGSVFNDPKMKRRRIFIDGHDGNGYLVDPRDVRVYIKRELRYPEICNMIYPNVRSLMFGIYQFLLDNPTPLLGDWERRDVDITFLAFGGSNPVRGQCEYVLKQLNNQPIYKGHRPFKIVSSAPANGQPVSIEEYRQAMRRTKIGINIVGAGIDCLRFWETMAHGAVLCSMDILKRMFIRDVPEPHRHALYFDTWTRMVELCRLVVSNKDRWQRMRQATDLLIKCHSTKARARQLLRLCAELA